jgi:hypothetical protein
MRDDINPKPEDVAASDIDTRKVHVTFFKNYAAKTLTTDDLTLAALRDRILAEVGPTKAKLPWLKLATFGETKSDKNSLRWDENVTGIEGIELDYDNTKKEGWVSFEDAVEQVRAMKARCLIYTSPSYTTAAPKWRLLLPTSNPLPKEMREKLVARVSGYFGNIFDPASFTLSQGFYYGRSEQWAKDNPDADHKARVIDGDFIDLHGDLSKFEAAGMKGAGKTANDKTNQTANGVRGFEANLALLGDGPGLDGFNNPLGSATASYAAIHGVDLDREVLKARLREAINKAPKKPERLVAEIERYLSDDYLDKRIESAIKKFGHDGLGPIVSGKDHVARARRMCNLRRPHMLHYRDDFMDFDAGAYRVVDDGVITADTWVFLDKARASRMVGRGKDAKQEIVPFQPDRNSVGETLAALKAVAHLNPDTETPCWLNGRDDLSVDALIAFPNGLLDLRSNILHPVDPNFFTIAALGFDYVAAAPKPTNWLNFLDEIFAGDDKDEQIAALQEIFG